MMAMILEEITKKNFKSHKAKERIPIIQKYSLENSSHRKNMHYDMDHTLKPHP